MDKFACLLFLLAALAFSDAYISDIEVDVHHGQIYVAGNYLYELDNAAVVQNAVHSINGSIEFGTLFVGKRNNKRVLYAYLGAGVEYEFDYYSLPLRDDVLAPTASLVMPKGLSLPSTYDLKDARAIHSVSRNITLVDLNTMKVLDSHYQWVGSRIFGRNIVYNHINKRVTIFRTYVPYRGDYGLSVDEFDVSTGHFVEANSTYNCLCGDGYDAKLSPFYKVVFTEQCSIDYSVTPARIWCAYSTGKQLFSFKADNLSVFQVINTTAPFDSVAWDFTNRIAYAIYDKYGNEGADGFEVRKVQLSNGAIVTTYNNTAISIDPSVFALDPNEPHLYLTVNTGTNNESIVSLNTNNMSATKVVTLTGPSA